MPKIMEHASTIERRVATALVARALNAGYTVSVRDDAFGEGEWVVKKSKDEREILGALCSTGSDFLRMRNEAGESVGWVALIWGNGEDLVSDYSDNEAIAKLVEG